MLSTGTGTATPPLWTPGGGDALAFGVGVANALGITGVGPGVGVGLWAKAVGQTIDAPRSAPQTMDSLIDLTEGIWFTTFPPR